MGSKIKGEVRLCCQAGLDQLRCDYVRSQYPQGVMSPALLAARDCQQCKTGLKLVGITLN